MYITGEMDPSGGSVPPGPNLTGGMEPGINTEYMKSKYVRISLRNIKFFTVLLKMHFSVRTVFQMERVCTKYR